MQQRRLGLNGPAVSMVGLGCMGMSENKGADAYLTDAECISTICAAIDAGISLLNTADFYGMGHNEHLVGEAIRHRRDQVFLSVKCGLLRDPSGTILGIDGRPNAIKSYAAYSLQRLGVDVIDLYAPCRVDPTVPFEETVGAVADLIAEGKVRYLGVSEVDENQLRLAHAVHPITSVEIEYSLVNRGREPGTLAFARSAGIGVSAYGVLAQGLLTDALAAALRDGTLAASYPRLKGASYERSHQILERYLQIATAMTVTPSQLAIAWCLSRGEHIVPIVGMSRKSRLADVLGAAAITLPPGVLTELDTLFQPDAVVRGVPARPTMKPISQGGQEKT